MDAIPFIGQHERKRDGQGRIPFPEAFRSLILPASTQQQSTAAQALRLVVQREFDNPYLTILTLEEGKKKTDLYRSKFSPYDEEEQRILADLFDNMENAELDGAGRITIKPRFIDDVGLGKDVIFVGWDNEIQLWDKARYEASRLNRKKPEMIAKAKEILRGVK